MFGPKIDDTRRDLAFSGFHLGGQCLYQAGITEDEMWLDGVQLGNQIAGGSPAGQSMGWVVRIGENPV
jgi:hypothetical protein